MISLWGGAQNEYLMGNVENTLSSHCSARENTWVGGDDIWGVLQPLTQAAALHKKQKNPPEWLSDCEVNAFHWRAAENSPKIKEDSC